MTVRAFDADDPATDNAALRYNIIRQSPDNPSSKMFYIDAENGDIFTAISPVLLDREVSLLKNCTCMSCTQREGACGQILFTSNIHVSVLASRVKTIRVFVRNTS